jgi:hypothetical protein
VKPIPLSSPDGLVYAYACSVCHHVRAGAATYEPDATGPILVLVEASLERSTRCCTCIRCGAPLSTDDRGDWAASCGDCLRDWNSQRMWVSIACCMQHGFLSADQLDRYLSAGDDT